jgi:hypothetical protein
MFDASLAVRCVHVRALRGGGRRTCGAVARYWAPGHRCLDGVVCQRHARPSDVLISRSDLAALLAMDVQSAAGRR